MKYTRILFTKKIRKANEGYIEFIKVNMIQVLMSKLIGLKNDERIVRILEMAIPVLTGIFIFIVPFPHNSAIQEICFYLSIFLALILYLCKNRELSFQSPLTVPFILFLTWTVVGLATALNKQNTFHDIYAHLLKYLAIFYLVTNFFNNRKRFIILTWILIISASIFSIGGIVYFYIISGNDLSARIGLPEIGIGVNYVGFFTIVAILFSITHLTTAANLSIKFASTICMFVPLVATILTGTRGTFLGLILPLFLLFSRHKKTVITFFLIFLVITSLFTPVKQILTPDAMINKVKTESRLVIWHNYLNMIKDYPIAGIGYGIQTYDKKLIDKYDSKDFPLHQLPYYFAPHNTFIDVTVRLGLVGLALFLYIIFVFGRMGWQLIRHGYDDFIRTWALCVTAIFVSFLIQGMVADMLLGIQIIIFFVLMAMMSILWRINGDCLV